jgi:Xaa-Pro dipeptidase
MAEAKASGPSSLAAWMEKLSSGVEKYFKPDFFLKKRKALVEKLASIDPSKTSIICLQGGKGMTRYDTDRDLLFRQESNFWYLTGVTEPDFSAIITIPDARFHLFMPKLNPSYAVWLGKIESKESVGKTYGADEIHYTEEFSDVLKSIAPTMVYTTKVLACPEAQPFPGDVEELAEEISKMRVVKDPEEIAVIRKATKITSDAVVECMKLTRPLLTELELASLFRFHTMRKGCNFMAFSTIASCGTRTAILHNMKQEGRMRDGEHVLLDAGGELSMYASDITRCFPVNKTFSPDQRQIYEIVLKAQEAVIAVIKPGVDWTDMHRLAERVVTEGLIAAEFFKGCSVEQALEMHLCNFFFPHGVGHLMGLDVHDVGGYPRGGPGRIQEPGIRYLRARLVLQENMIFTVEPGVYFIDALLDELLHNEQLVQYVNTEKVEKFRNFGGIRIEDDILVTADGVEVLTSAPKTIEDIEKLRKYTY